jgi:2-polyprenyl-6-methoxyphenol hydroxylase-like FAD-dependent oxidoreductase
MTNGRARYDALIAGGGPAGAALALGLARDGWRVALVECGHYESESPGESLPASREAPLRRLGVWNGAVRMHLGAAARLHGLSGKPGAGNPLRAHPLGGAWRIDR